MARAIRWVRYGFCTCLGLALIGLAAVSPPVLDPEGSSAEPEDSVPSGSMRH
jgi:hypothetical protein